MHFIHYQHVNIYVVYYKQSYFYRFIIEKCDGVLTIENKKKKAMIEELVQRGYDSDPVKAWKIQQDREALLVSQNRMQCDYMSIHEYVNKKSCKCTTMRSLNCNN